VLENLSVEDNLAVAVRKQKSWWSNLGFGLSKAEGERLEEILELVGLSAKRGLLASSLAHGEKQWLELGMVVAADPELLLLDEPTAGMTAAETAKTAELILRLAGRHTILVIDHDMSFVELLGAPISVLHMGRLFKEGDLQSLRDDPSVIEIYLGRSKEN
jgi:urea transport system ATP-binding protein